MSFNPKNASGRKSAKPSFPTEKTIPRADPYPPVLPDGDGYAVPTQPTEKLITKKPEAQFKIFSPVRQHETEKKAVMSIPPAHASSNQNELDALRKEIERLKAEIERLRAEIARLQEERVQIINTYEDRRSNQDVALVRLMIEVERLNGHLVEKNREIDMLRANQNQSIGVPDAQVRSYLAKIEEYENRLRMLEPELQQWRYKYSQLEKDSEMRRVTMEEEIRRRLEIEISHIRMNDQGYNESRYNQLLREKQEMESRFMAMTTELEKLNGLNRRYQEESEMLRRRIDELTLELSRNQQNPDLQKQVILLSSELERLNGILNDKHREADNLRTRVIETENHHARQIEQVKQAHAAEAGNIDKHRFEMQEQMKIRYENQMKELTVRFSNERAALEAEIRQLRNRITELDSQINRTNIDSVVMELNAKFMQERTNYEAKIRELLARIQELETKISLVSVEAERMHAAAEMRAREAESWREKYTRLESAKLEEVQLIISQNANLQRRVSVTNDETEKIMRLFKELESEHSILGSKYQQISRELEDMRRNRSSYVIEETYRPASVQDIRLRIQSINTEKNEYRDSTYPQEMNKSSTNVRETYY